MTKLLNFLKPAPPIARLPADQIEAAYKKHRYQNFIGIFIGYAGYYLLRKNFSLAMPYLLQLGFSKSQLGLILSSIPIAYGISKFLMGNISDRSNPRYFIVMGLIISIIVNLIFGCATKVTTSLFIMFVLMFINGWAQGMGGPPCFRTVAHWFAVSERGRVVSIWDISHNLGAGLLGAFAIIIVPLLGWKSIFYVPSIIVSVLALIVLVLLRDTPQSVGLMPIEEYSHEYPGNGSAKDKEYEMSGKEILFQHVLVNKYVWFLSLANIFVYTIRYGILYWAPAYLTETKGLRLDMSGITFVVYEIAGILGMLFCGYLSDKYFKRNRAYVSIICMFMVCIGIILYWYSPQIILSNIALFLIGMFIYGPVMLIGVQVLDIMPKKAVGTAIGLLGLFGYWGGTILASVGFGYLVELLGWGGVFITLIISCTLAVFFLGLTLNIKTNSVYKGNNYNP